MGASPSAPASRPTLDKVRDLVLKAHRAEGGPERADRREGPRAAQAGRLGHAARVPRRRRQAARAPRHRREVLQARAGERRSARSATAATCMLPDDAKSVYVVADPLALASAKSADWIRRTGFAAEKVKAMDVAAGGRRDVDDRARAATTPTGSSRRCAPARSSTSSAPMRPPTRSTAWSSPTSRRRARSRPTPGWTSPPPPSSRRPSTASPTRVKLGKLGGRELLRHGRHRRARRRRAARTPSRAPEEDRRAAAAREGARRAHPAHRQVEVRRHPEEARRAAGEEGQPQEVARTPWKRTSRRSPTSSSWRWPRCSCSRRSAPSSPRSTCALGRAVDRRRALEEGLRRGGMADDGARAELAQIARRIRYVYLSDRVRGALAACSSAC